MKREINYKDAFAPIYSFTDRNELFWRLFGIMSLSDRMMSLYEYRIIPPVDVEEARELERKFTYTTTEFKLGNDTYQCSYEIKCDLCMPTYVRHKGTYTKNYLGIKPTEFKVAICDFLFQQMSRQYTEKIIDESNADKLPLLDSKAFEEMVCMPMSKKGITDWVISQLYQPQWTIEKNCSYITAQYKSVYPNGSVGRARLYQWLKEQQRFTL